MRTDTATGLVLEGGGMRCIFTVGVLDCLMDNQLWFPYVIGVSAGASNGISYISQQRGRSYFSNIELLKKHNYIGLKHLLKGNGYIDLHFLFYEYPDKYYPFDFEAYKKYPGRFVMVTSNCLTGQAEYIEEKQDYKRTLDACKASCTLPVMCPISYVDDIPMVDGGVCDAIPIRHAVQDGFTQNVIVLTRNKGYRKPDKEFHLPSFIYHQYPAIQEKLRLRYKNYNQTLDYIDSLEAEGKVLVIRPEKPLQVTRTERNTAKLQDLYEEGYACAQQLKEQLKGLCGPLK